jgi:hemerythrin
MNMVPEHAVEKIQRDHDYLFELMDRIAAVCDKRSEQINCRTCGSDRRVVCQGNVHQLIQTFTEATLKHHAVEAFYMADSTPPEHRTAHVRAHMAIAEKLKAIRVEFSEDGNCITAIDGVEQAVAAIRAHIDEFDAPLERMLMQPANV